MVLIVLLQLVYLPLRVEKKKKKKGDFQSSCDLGKVFLKHDSRAKRYLFFLM